MARIVTRFVTGTVAAAVIVAVIFAVLGSTGSGSGTTDAGAPSSAPSSQPSSAPVAAASSGPCTSHACITRDAQGMVGTVAKDNSVLTKMKCRKSTVRQPTPGVWTVHCTATYSDGSVWSGIASVLLSQGKVAWQATGEISGG